VAGWETGRMEDPFFSIQAYTLVLIDHFLSISPFFGYHCLMDVHLANIPLLIS
jgi:hypothetical protein